MPLHVIVGHVYWLCALAVCAPRLLLEWARGGKLAPYVIYGVAALAVARRSPVVDPGYDPGYVYVDVVG